MLDSKKLHCFFCLFVCFLFFPRLMFNPWLFLSHIVCCEKYFQKSVHTFFLHSVSSMQFVYFDDYFPCVMRSKHTWVFMLQRNQMLNNQNIIRLTLDTTDHWDQSRERCLQIWMVNVIVWASLTVLFEPTVKTSLLDKERKNHGLIK